jgi:hypothetical protein
MEPVTPPSNRVTPSEPPITMPVTPGTPEASITDRIQAICAVVQTAVFCIMVYTVFQTQAQVRQASDSLDLSKKQFDLAQKQFEATIEPVIEISNSGSHLFIENRGTIPVSNIEISGVFHAVYTSQSGGQPLKIHRSYLDRDRKPSIFNGRFVSGMFTNAPIDFSLPPSEKLQVDPMEVEIIGFIVSYRRSVDMKPYGYLHLVMVMGDPPKVVPLDSIWSGPTGPHSIYDYVMLRQDIEQELKKLQVTGFQ